MLFGHFCFPMELLMQAESQFSQFPSLIIRKHLFNLSISLIPPFQVCLNIKSSFDRLVIKAGHCQEEVEILGNRQLVIKPHYDFHGSRLPCNYKYDPCPSVVIDASWPTSGPLMICGFSGCCSRFPQRFQQLYVIFKNKQL